MAFLLLLPLVASATSLRRASSLLPSSYVNPVFQQSRSNIESDALASIDALLGMPDYPYGTWVGQNGFTAVAQWDTQHKTTTFETQFSRNETYYAQNPGGCYPYWKSPAVDCYNDDAGWAAMANLEGYAAYGNKSYLQTAESVHKFVSDHGFINQTVIDEGYLKGTHFSNNTLRPTCDGKSMLGGVYWQNGVPLPGHQPADAEAAADPAIDSGSTAVYALSSAMLCAITSSMGYCNKSYDALQFMDRFLIDPGNGLVNGHILGSNCSQATSFVVSSTTGNYIAAYALLSNLTSNSTALAMARNTTILGLTTDIWNTDKGVLTDIFNHPNGSLDAVGLKSVFIRRLNFVYPYMDSEVQEAILQYVNIQYWSMVNYDSDNPTKPLLYGNNWQGPEYKNATGTTQLQALDVFNALSLNPDSAFPNVNSTDKPVIGL